MILALVLLFFVPRHIQPATRLQVLSEGSDDPIRRATLQGWLGSVATLGRKPSSSNPPREMRRTLSTGQGYVMVPPSNGQPRVWTSAGQDCVQWKCPGWILDVSLQQQHSDQPSVEQWTSQRLLEVQEEHNCVATSTEASFRIPTASDNSYQLHYTTRSRPLRTGCSEDWITRVFFRDNFSVTVHCHGVVLPAESLEILESVNLL